MCVQPWTKTMSLTTKGGWEKRYESLPKNKRQKRARKKKRRYMKSSCRWAIIHFHFEVLWTVVKCDCMWQSPSLPVYHDGCTLPPRWCCTACVCACTNTDRRMNTERHRSGIMLGRCTQKQNYMHSHVDTHYFRPSFLLSFSLCFLFFIFGVLLTLSGLIINFYELFIYVCIILANK